jgi:hypothetical protein
LLRILVDLFPAFGALAAVTALVGGLTERSSMLNALTAICGFVPLLAWAIGVTRLPPGATPEVGLALIASGSLAVLIGLAIELAVRPSPRSTGDN